MPNKNQPDIPLLLFFTGLACLIFLSGGFFGVNNLPPYRWVNEKFDAAKAISVQLKLKRPPGLGVIYYPEQGTFQHQPKRTTAGLTLIQGIFSDGVAVRLIDLSGKIVKEWPLKLYEVWPKLEHIPLHRRPASDFNFHSQGMVALPDGSIVVNYSLLGLVKYDRCGKIVWTVDRMTHHSVTLDEDGSFWVPTKTYANDVADDLLFSWYSREELDKSPLKYEDRLLHISPDGEILEEISVLQAVVNAGMEPQIHDSQYINKEDPTHINFISIVTDKLAEKIENIKKGDLLVSIRQFHMLVIMDRSDGTIKWQHAGPWVRQHSPVILPNGNILIFNNGRQTQSFSQGRVKGSNLIEFNPETETIKIVYPTKELQSFYTGSMGSVQFLPGNNLLITDSHRGRVFEINSEGDTVWEHIEQYDESYAAHIDSAIRYDTDYFKVTNWSCAF
jgi:hypothetical protein